VGGCASAVPSVDFQDKDLMVALLLFLSESSAGAELIAVSDHVTAQDNLLIFNLVNGYEYSVGTGRSKKTISSSFCQYVQYTKLQVVTAFQGAFVDGRLYQDAVAQEVLATLSVARYSDTQLHELIKHNQGKKFHDYVRLIVKQLVGVKVFGMRTEYQKDDKKPVLTFDFPSYWVKDRANVSHLIQLSRGLTELEHTQAVDAAASRETACEKCAAKGGSTSSGSAHRKTKTASSSPPLLNPTAMYDR
jgi:hypothetical protein